MLSIKYKKKDTITSMITVDFQTKKVTVENFTDRLLDTAFGVRDNPTMEDFYNLLQRRCFSKDRRNCKQILDMLGVECYDKRHPSFYMLEGAYKALQGFDKKAC